MSFNINFSERLVAYIANQKHTQQNQIWQEGVELLHVWNKKHNLGTCQK